MARPSPQDNSETGTPCNVHTSPGPIGYDNPPRIAIDWLPLGCPTLYPCALITELAHEGSSVLLIALLLYATMVQRIIFFPADVDGIEVTWILTSWRPQGIQSMSRFISSPGFGLDLTLELGPFANYDLPCLKELYVDMERVTCFSIPPLWTSYKSQVFPSCTYRMEIVLRIPSLDPLKTHRLLCTS